MIKFSLAIATIFLLGISSATFASGADGAFFASAGLGQAQHKVDFHQASSYGYSVDKNSTAGALRFGYVWLGKVDLGVEGGYADLGDIVLESRNQLFVHRSKSSFSGWLLGANGKFHFAGSDWNISARGGWMRSTEDDVVSLNAPDVSSNDKYSFSGNGWYVGTGLGYDFSPRFGLGVNFDNYHVRVRANGASPSHDVIVCTVGAEYRF